MLTFHLKIQNERPITISFENAADLKKKLSKLKFADDATVIGQNNTYTTLENLKNTLLPNVDLQTALCTVGCGHIENAAVKGACSYVCHGISEVADPKDALFATACFVGVVLLLTYLYNARK